MQISGTATSGSCLCRRASLKRASGRNTEGARWSLPSTIGQAMSVRSIFSSMMHRNLLVLGDEVFRRWTRPASRRPPLRIAVLEPADAIAPSPQCCDGFERKDVIGTAAVGDHLAARRPSQ